MEAIFENCCGIDVHKKTLTACIMIGGEGKITKKEIRTYSTMTEDIEGLRDWLKSEGVTHVAMESTGIYWRPVYNILEEGFEIMLVNARHIKNVPGRKTDVADSEWLCRLLRNGLLNGSFIPPIYIRQLRDLTRYRSKLNNNIAAEKNRLQKDLELLDTIPGVDKIGATAIVAEIGADMSKFPTDAHISSWAGMSPGNNESAGKKKAQGPRMETYG